MYHVGGMSLSLIKDKDWKNNKSKFALDLYSGVDLGSKLALKISTTRHEIIINTCGIRRQRAVFVQACPKETN